MGSGQFKYGAGCITGAVGIKVDQYVVHNDRGDFAVFSLIGHVSETQRQKQLLGGGPAQLIRFFLDAVTGHYFYALLSKGGYNILILTIGECIEITGCLLNNPVVPLIEVELCLCLTKGLGEEHQAFHRDTFFVVELPQA